KGSCLLILFRFCNKGHARGSFANPRARPVQSSCSKCCALKQCASFTSNDLLCIEFQFTALQLPQDACQTCGPLALLDLSQRRPCGQRPDHDQSLHWVSCVPTS